ncbi:serine hydrolase domain-containing protein [Amycolatopsis dendrobii]|uniref:Beta-lactamase family protein n=1 Tax=Amycolatopsis dendrobii TaxID=2760662 RepID=A0A7W3VWU1_9PSEU|nr:serine hydrolase domain-containing protein [Amycolatopsis dendrobii]MBB1154474.1 beta-lactamase family protein [Amycolatopsis dendrobii]
MLPAMPLALAASLLAPAAPAAAVADPVRTLAQEIVSSGATGVQIRTVHNGHARTVTAGVSELDSQRPVSPTGRFRIGSATKMFTSTVVLQLVAERRLQLDAPVERYLPGLLPHGNEITVRMLLQHTSGLYDYTESLPLRGADFQKIRYQHRSPESMVAVSTGKPLDFPPGSKHAYSNTNFIVLGMLIERTTGHAWGVEATQRILVPLGMHRTSVPGDRTGIPGPHAHGYQEMDGKLVDVTELNPSMAGSAGEMISTTADLDKFLCALAAGRLVPPDLLAQMTKPWSATDQYGLGLRTPATACGARVFGHSGGIPGFQTVAFTSPDGKQRVEASVTLGRGLDLDLRSAVLDTVFCR